MQFSENGRLALLNPFALIMMFGRHKGDGSTHASYFVRGRLDALQESYGSDDPVESIIETAFALAQVIHLTIKLELSSEELDTLPSVIKNERRLPHCIFRAPGKDNRGEVPNIHLLMHYMQDLRNYGTLYNNSTIVGQQKYKVHKAHAPHTNSQDRVL
jgi:hypothetical protein